MATALLADAIAGAIRPGQTITWTDEDGTAVDLTGATLTGFLRELSTGVTRGIAGTLTLNTPASGIFDWAYDLTDVVEGEYEVQFNRAYLSGPTPGKNFVTRWTVRRALAV